VGYAVSVIFLCVAGYPAYAQTNVPTQATGNSGGVVRRSGTAFPNIRLPRASQGNDAIALLGSRLAEIAAWHGMSTEKFQNILRFDRTARIDINGRLHFVEQIPQQTSSSNTSTSVMSAYAPLNQTFVLHSKPGANRVIYLNFVGATLSNTVWNARAGNTTIVAQGFDLDGSPGSFSESELSLIQRAWQRVVEDFSPFDVDVTTEPPSESALTRSSAVDVTFGTTVLVTKNTFETGCGCGGWAYLSVFDDFNNYYKPAVVFYDQLGNSEKNIAEAISHEAGHNVGLAHDGAIGGVQYYYGHGTGSTGWAPIMGAGYNRELVQWSRGEYPNANNTEDDFLVMQQTGLPYRADDHGNSFSTTTPIVFSGGSKSATASGIIGSQSDVDIFQIPAGSGLIRVHVAPAPLAPNLDVLARLYASDGSLLASANIAGELYADTQATRSPTAPLYLSISGTGKGDPLLDGYTAYGSIGQYNVTVRTASVAEWLTPILNLIMSQ